MGRKKIRKNAVLAGVSAMALIVVFLGVFTLSLTLQVKEESRQQLEEVTAQGVNLVRGRVDDAFASLEAIAESLSGLDDLAGEGAMRLLQEQASNTLYARLAVALPDGWSFSPGDAPLQIGGRAYFQKTMGGERCISEILSSQVDGEPSLVFAVPIRRGSSVVGVLRGTYHQSRLRELLVTEIFGGQGRITVMRSDGSIVTPVQGGPESFSQAQGGFPACVENADPRFCEVVRSGGAGSFATLYDGEPFLVRYEPVGRADWYVIAAIPMRVIEERVGAIVLRVLFLLVASLLVLAFWTYRVYRSQLQYDARLRKEERGLQALADNVPGGVQIFRNDAAFSSLYLSSGFLYLTGYTPEELEEMPRGYQRVILREDWERVRPEMKRQLEGAGVYRAEYRIRTKDGEERWVADAGRLVNDEETREDLVYCVVIDITESVHTRQKLLLSEERYRLIMEHTNNILFDWDLAAGSTSFTTVWENQFGGSSETGGAVEAFERSGAVHPEDLPRLTAMLRDASSGRRTYAEEMVRLKSVQNEYLWRRACVSVIPDALGRPGRAVGALFDVNREKREAEDMQRRAERDSLTRLHNKGAFEQWARRCLAEENPENLHALILVDVDDFKTINDNYGHVFGDVALKAAAAALRGPFRASDIVGRVGGDEFAVLVRGASRTLAARKARDICENFSKIGLGDEGAVHVSCSVGIALFPDDGKSYDTLYAKADEALYQAKRSGKNRSCFWEASGSPGDG